MKAENVLNWEVVDREARRKGNCNGLILEQVVDDFIYNGDGQLGSEEAFRRNILNGTYGKHYWKKSDGEI